MSQYNYIEFEQSGGFRHPESEIYEPATLVNLKNIQIMRGVRIDSFCYILGGEGVRLGERTHLASSVSIGGGGKFETGWCVGISSGVRIITGGDDPIGLAGACIPKEFRTVKRGHVSIGDFTMLFTNVIVLQNVDIGEGCVVYAGSIVNRSLDPWGIYAGNPIRKIGTRDKTKILADAAIMKEKYGF